MHKKHIASTLKFAVFLMFILIFLTSSVVYVNAGFSVSALKEWALSYGDNVWIATFFLTIIFTSFGLPILIPMALASLLFSVKTASLLVCLGMYIGASIAFFIARWLGKDYIEEKFINKHKHLKFFDQKLHNHGFYTVLVSRLIFIIPFEFVNLVSGVSKVRFRDYIIATIIGATPGMVLTIYMMQKIDYVYTLQFIAASTAFILITLIPLISKKIRKAVF